MIAEFVKLPRKTLNKVLAYLRDKPWKEVNDLIIEVHRETTVEEPKKQEDRFESFSQTSRFRVLN